MFQNMVRSAHRVGIDMSNLYVKRIVAPVGAYNTDTFQKITKQKLQYIYDNLLHDDILWVDNDIVFFENCIPDVIRDTITFSIQDDLWGFCTGFFYAKKNYWTLLTIQRAIEWLDSQQHFSLNDQHAFNEVLKTEELFGDVLCTLRVLPSQEYPVGFVYFNLKLRAKARMLHNNYLMTTAEKIERFKQEGLWYDNETDSNIVAEASPDADVSLSHT